MILFTTGFGLKPSSGNSKSNVISILNYKNTILLSEYIESTLFFMTDFIVSYFFNILKLKLRGPTRKMWNQYVRNGRYYTDCLPELGLKNNFSMEWQNASKFYNNDLPITCNLERCNEYHSVFISCLILCSPNTYFFYPLHCYNSNFYRISM